MKVIVIDCGSTQATTAVFDRDTAAENSVSYIPLPHGLNAVTAAEGAFKSLCDSCCELSGIADEVSEVYFYGAGCATDDICTRVAGELGAFFSHAATVSVATDMLAAARALCGDEQGIVAILGTGSNSCLYDGTRIVANVSPLGYILGDEGSGAVLGRLFIGRVLKQQFPEEVLRRFADVHSDITAAEVVTRVYRTERPNAYLASFCPFIASCLDIPEVTDFVVDEFCRFIRYNLSHYLDTSKYSHIDSHLMRVHFTGSIAHYFAPQLRIALAESAPKNDAHTSIATLTLGKILPSPLPSLANYHLNHPSITGII